MALSMTVIPSVLWAQKPATEHTIRANETVKTELNFNDRQDFEDANRGFIASIDGKAVLGKDGKVSYSVEEWDFLKNETPQTVNPCLLYTSDAADEHRRLPTPACGGSHSLTASTACLK